MTDKDIEEIKQLLKEILKQLIEANSFLSQIAFK